MSRCSIVGLLVSHRHNGTWYTSTNWFDVRKTNFFVSNFYQNPSNFISHYFFRYVNQSLKSTIGSTHFWLYIFILWNKNNHKKGVKTKVQNHFSDPLLLISTLCDFDIKLFYLCLIFHTLWYPAHMIKIVDIYCIFLIFLGLPFYMK